MNEATIHDRQCRDSVCDRLATKRGFCNKHYNIAWQRGEFNVNPYIKLSLSRPKEIREHLLRFRKITDHGCWEWSRCRNPEGYGTMVVDGKHYPPHRMSKHIFDSFDLNSSLKILHKCDNPPCFNPDHLFPGTDLDNMRDMFKKGRANKAKGERQSEAKLTEGQVRTIRDMRKNGSTYLSIAKGFGVTESNIHKICERITWKHVE